MSEVNSVNTRARLVLASAAASAKLGRHILAVMRCQCATWGAVQVDGLWEGMINWETWSALHSRQ